MQINKQEIVDLLRSRGEQEVAERAKAELPDQLDSAQHADQLGTFGVSPAELAGLKNQLDL